MGQDDHKCGHFVPSSLYQWHHDQSQNVWQTYTLQANLFLPFIGKRWTNTAAPSGTNELLLYKYFCINRDRTSKTSLQTKAFAHFYLLEINYIFALVSPWGINYIFALVPLLGIHYIFALVPLLGINYIFALVPLLGINYIFALVPLLGINNIFALVPLLGINYIFALVPPSGINYIFALVSPLGINYIFASVPIKYPWIE